MTASEKKPRSRRQALVRAIVAVRSADPATVEAAVADLGGRRRWLKPLAYVAGTVAVVFDGILLLLSHWRLTLLQLIPAVWIWTMTWNLKNRTFASSEITVALSILIAVAVLLAAQASYWCNATFAYTMVQEGKPHFRAAFREARPHWRFVGGLALLTGGLQAVIWLLVPHAEPKWVGFALLLMYFVQIYLFIAVPTWLLGVRKTGTSRDRAIRTMTTGVLAGVASAPGFLLNRLGLLLLGSSVWVIGGAILAVGAVLQVGASSSVRVVKMSLKLRPAEQGAAPGDADEGEVAPEPEATVSGRGGTQ